MPRPTPSTEILNLFHSLDSQDDWHRQRSVVVNWLGSWPGVEEALFFDVRLSDEGFGPEDFLFSPYFHQTLTPQGPKLHYAETHPEWKKGSLYYPLPPFRGRSPGVLLIRCAHPAKLYQERRADLALLSSKVRDLLALDEATSHPVFPKSHRPSFLEHETPTQGPGLETPHLPVYLADDSGCLVDFNAAFGLLFGYASVEELQARDKPFFHPVDRTRELQDLRKSNHVDGYTLSVQHASGRFLKVKDYAVRQNGQIRGILFDVTQDDEEKAQMREALRLQEHLNNAFLTATLTLEKTQTTSIRALARLAEYRDHETGWHLERISEYSRILATEVLRTQPLSFQISETYVEDLTLSSLLHDIGKVGIPDAILRKKGPLSDEEWAVMKKHTEWGWEILNQADKELGQQSFLTMAGQIALNHHEKWDGTGYPRGLRGDEIPLSARIEAIADVYDALTSARPYKEAWSHEDSVDTIVKLRGVQFDPVLVDIFWSVQENFKQVKQRFANARTADSEVTP
jgi:response regulator RpfG family c-di-GMP phosphodiesterase